MNIYWLYSLIAILVVACFVLIIMLHKIKNSLHVNELEALKREVQNYGYASAYGAMTWLHNMGWSGFISLSVIHAKRMEGRTIQIEVFRKYEQATLSELDSLVKQGVLFKRTELNNLSHEVWYKLVHIPRIARVV